MKIRSLLFTGFSFLAAIVAVMQIIAFQSNAAEEKTDKWLTHTYKVIGEIRQIEKLMLDIETAERGYLLTGDESFLEPQHQADDLYPLVLADLKNLMSDNPAQVEQLKEIEALISNWQEQVIHPAIELREKLDAQSEELDTGDTQVVTLQDIEAFVQSKVGKNFMDDIRKKFDAFISVEQDLLMERKREDDVAQERNRDVLIIGTLLFFVVGVFTLVAVLRGVMKQVGGEPVTIAAITNQIAEGDFASYTPTGEETGILASVGVMLEALKLNRKKIGDQNWLNEGITGLDDVMRGSQTVSELCTDIITYTARYLDVQVGTLSLANTEGTRLSLMGGYAYQSGPEDQTEFEFGEGLIGQVAREKKQLLLQNVSEDGLTIRSALGEIVPDSLVCVPLLYTDEVVGVMELGSLRAFTDRQLEFLEKTSEAIAIAINSAMARERMDKLLEESQAQAEELETQQEELKVANEELELKRQEMETQQEELRVSNEELEQKNDELSARRSTPDSQRGEY